MAGESEQLIDSQLLGHKAAPLLDVSAGVRELSVFLSATEKREHLEKPTSLVRVGRSNFP